MVLTKLCNNHFLSYWSFCMILGDSLKNSLYVFPTRVITWVSLVKAIGEGNGNPLQCSCLENPRDGRAWWAAVFGVTQSWTQLKRLSSSTQGYGFSSSHIWMWELDCEESWALKNWCFWTVVLEKTRESPLDCKEIQPVHSKGDQSWVFFGRTDAKAETPVLWPPHAKSWLIGKDSHAGRDWGQEEKGTTEDEMAGWHHRLDGREFEWTLEVGDATACCDSWGRKELDTTERLNWIDMVP